MKLPTSDYDTMLLLQEEYDRLMDRWKDARPYSQEVANLHESFKAWERRLGRVVGNGLFQRILAARSD